MRRHAALRCAVGDYGPLGFNATWAYLRATACPAPDLRRDSAALLRALGTLEESRAAHLAEMDAFAARRRVEKAAGRRTPRASDTAALRFPRWPGSAPPSRLGLIAAVANRRSAFQRFPYPDETLSPDVEVRQLANLHARLEDCAASYLKALGRLEQPAAAELTDTVHGIRSLTRPGYSPLNMYLLPWLRFANLLTYAAGASFAIEHLHQQYLDKNPGGYCGLGGTGVKPSDPFGTNWGASCPTGIASVPEVADK